VITPRRTRLLRAVDLRAFQRAIAEVASYNDPWTMQDCVVMVPTHAATEQLKRTLEYLSFTPDNPKQKTAVAGSHLIAWPHFVTRRAWYTLMHGRLKSPPRLLTDVEREVLLQSASGDTTRSGVEPPFEVRPGLLPEILTFYDILRRQHKTVNAFERVVTEKLELDVALDRGARRLLEQTRFLVSVFRDFEQKIEESDGLDEHALRALLLTDPCLQPVRHVVVTVPDQAASENGLWPADFDLLTRLPGLERVDVIATEQMLQSGLLERIHERLPGIEEEPCSRVTDPTPVRLMMVDGKRCRVVRDREEELIAVAKDVKWARQDGPQSGDGVDIADDSTAVVFQRPLPYLYLAKQAFGACGVPFETFDSLPLAAEPYAAALNLVFACIDPKFSRSDLVALLRSPHFKFLVDESAVTHEEVSALDRHLAQFPHDDVPIKLKRLLTEAQPDQDLIRRAARAALKIVEELTRLASRDRTSRLVTNVLAFLTNHATVYDETDSVDRRLLQVRATMHGVLHDLRTAHVSHHDPEADLAEVWANIQVWIERRAVQLESDQGGVQLLDAQAACYGSFTSVTIVGLIEKDWPQQRSRSIFYPPSMLEQLFQSSSVSPDSSQVARTRAERARFRDLLGLSTDQLRLSSFTLDHLEQDALVNPSTFIEEDLENLEVDVRLVNEEAPSDNIKIDEALMLRPVDPSVVQGEAATWLSLRLATNDLSESKRSLSHENGPEGITFSPTGVERYLACPFKYFADKVLKLEEEREELSRVSPLEQGTWLHKILQEFYKNWPEPINDENIDLALERCAGVVEKVLTEHETAQLLPQAERALERSRFLGSIAKRGLIDRVLRFDAEQDLAVVDRLLEHELKDKFKFKSSSGTRSVSLLAYVDRIDLLQDRSFQVVDYKLGLAPNRNLAVQLPIYAVCSEQALADRLDGPWKIGDAQYLAFKKEGLAESMVGRGKTLTEALDDGQQRFLDAVDGIFQREFPVRPAEPFNCKYCGYSTVCRKKDVEDS